MLEEMADRNRSVAAIIEWIKMGGSSSTQRLNPVLQDSDPQTFHYLMSGQLLFDPVSYTGIAQMNSALSDPKAIPLVGSQSWKESQKKFQLRAT
jgi:hypothetical protein